jgi:N-acetylmuramoyl-L-alanine amidase
MTVKTTKRLIAAALVLGLLLAMAAGCAMWETEHTMPSVPTPIIVPTEPSTVPTAPPVTEPTATEPPATQPPDVEPPKKLLTVCIDAGHQRYGISEKEPNGPGSNVMKPKLTTGTRGVSTKTPEYQLNLDVSLLLEQELIARGYNVVMIRRDNDCPLSNAERAQVANDSGADIFVRIHANGSENTKVSGALCCAPTGKNPYLTDAVIEDSIRLSKAIVNSFCEATGANNQGLMSTDTMTGINWCEIPVTIVEMGYMSNAAEDEKMATEEYRQKMVQGVANGIDAYFGV